MMTHELKVWPEYFGALWRAEKRFEVRERRDRDFQVGDRLRLREWSEATGHSGREIEAEVTYVLEGGIFGVAPGHCVMSLVNFRRSSPDPLDVDPMEFEARRLGYGDGKEEL